MAAKSSGQVEQLLRISRWLSGRVDKLSFAQPVTHIYNPLAYARAPHEDYFRRYAEGTGRVLLLGMNPGPWGMVQTGVPFGEVAMARDWLKIEGRVRAPKIVHEKRPVDGFACKRSEVSGKRLWSWAEERFGTPQAFFERFFVVNYCPLTFMEESARNRTPDKLPATERDDLYEVCDEALRRMVGVLKPSRIVGIGRFAELRAKDALGAAKSAEIFTIPVGRMLHPSPASPIANRGWAPQAEKNLLEQGVRLD